ncbi:MAG: aspartyl-tRNA(Asn)/glutamyl-tRNA(Gln) amidotransferase subunit [Bradyrhizobium sp.]|nr:aspartyl-tRNA(Asn)/glutamyl-tRNA(Gln) amidotransferase subunit [Bradyrhizobium sp.]
MIFGKTTTSEFGNKIVTESPSTGIIRNPWKPEWTSGGSSGGAGAATAAGLGRWRSHRTAADRFVFRRTGAGFSVSSLRSNVFQRRPLPSEG